MHSPEVSGSLFNAYIHLLYTVYESCSGDLKNIFCADSELRNASWPSMNDYFKLRIIEIFFNRVQK